MYPQKYKQVIIQQTKNYSINTIANNFGCSKNSIYRWKDIKPISKDNVIIPVAGILKKRFGNINDKMKEKLLLTTEGLYSLSYYKDADVLSEIIKSEFSENITITDGTANVGGNVISFAKYFKVVNAIELDKVNFKALKNNIKVYDFKNVNLFNDDSTKIIFNMKQDVLFLDPPWGGVDYKQKESLDLFLNNKNISYWCNEVFKLTETKLIVLKVPNNFNKKKFFRNTSYSQSKIKKFKKYIVIFIYK